MDAERNMDETTTTLDRVRRIIADVLTVQIEFVVPDAEIIADLGASDLDIVDIAMDLEDDFSITISDDQVEGAKTVGDLVRVIDAATD